MNRDKRKKPSSSPGSQATGTAGAGQRHENDETESLRQLMNDHFRQTQERLDRLEKNMEAQIRNTMSRVMEMETKLTELITSVSYNANVTEKITTETIPQVEKNFKEKFENLSMELEKLSVYAARENIVFLGIAEGGGPAEPEDTQKVVRDFMKEKLKMNEEEVRGMEFQRVHRCPAPRGPRPIKARMLRYADKVKIMKNAKHLKGTKFVITDDLPKAVREARKPQFPLLHAAKDAGKRVFFSRAEPRKLYIESKFVPLGEQKALLDEFRNPGRERPVHFNI